MNKILYAKAVFGDEEKQAVQNALESNWLAAGPLTEQFEKEVAALFGKKYAVATNSGSSANLLAITSLQIPDGSEVITPACTFATTLAPLIQNNLTPIFVDCIPGYYTLDIEKVKDAITDKTAAIMVPQLIGGVANMKELREIADTHGLYLIDDSCDTLAPKYLGDTVASYADITTTSFYGSHIVTSMGSGGMVMTDNFIVYTALRSLINWGRVGSDNEDFKERFDFSIDEIPYDAKFLYSTIGYNLKMTEPQAAFGLEQLKRLPEFLLIRKKNFIRLYSYFKDYEKWFYLPELIDYAETNWLAFALTVRDEAPFKRYDLLEHLEKNGVQTRVIFSGNATRHPAYRGFNFNEVDLTNSDLVMRSGFLVGCHQGMSLDEVAQMTGIFEEFLCRQ